MNPTKTTERVDVFTRRKRDGGTAFPMQDAQTIHAYAVAAVDGIIDPDERDRLYTLARAQAVGGLTKREYFAGKALEGLLSNPSLPVQSAIKGLAFKHGKPGYVAAFCVDRADEILAALDDVSEKVSNDKDARVCLSETEPLSSLRAERDRLKEALADMVYSYGLEEDEFPALCRREDLTNQEYDARQDASLMRARVVLGQKVNGMLDAGENEARQDEGNSKHMEVPQAWLKEFDGQVSVVPAKTFLKDDALAAGWRPLVFGECQHPGDTD